MTKVLLVNDEDDLLTVAQLVLEDAGFEVAATVDGQHVVDLVRHDPPDVVLLDWVLRGTDGGKVLAELRADEIARPIPVVMMSALADGADRARRAGADSFLPKPFTADDLVQAVSGAVYGAGAGADPRAI
jgi:two-component system phosphate regulon response regulator PhoB